MQARISRVRRGQLRGRTQTPLVEEDAQVVDLGEKLRQRALEGDIDALLAWRAQLDPVPWEELGWGH